MCLDSKNLSPLPCDELGFLSYIIFTSVEKPQVTNDNFATEPMSE